MANTNRCCSFLSGRNLCISRASVSRTCKRAFHIGSMRGRLNLEDYSKTLQDRRLSSRNINSEWKPRNRRENLSQILTNSVSKGNLLKARSQLFRIQQCSNSRTFLTSQQLQGQEPWMISDYEVNSLINKCETAASVNRGIIDRYETNQLASNQPIEDRKFVVSLLQEDGGHLFGVLDGHGGDACAQSVCQRLPDYIGLALLPPEILMELSQDVPEVREYLTMTRNYEHDSHNYMNDPICRQSLYTYYKKLKQMYGSKGYKVDRGSKPRSSRGLFTSLAEFHDLQSLFKVNALSNAFSSLDEDILAEAQQFDEGGEINQHAFAAANAGACALVAHINGTELCIANTGDCRAVLGVENEDNSWSAIQLSSDHTADIRFGWDLWSEDVFEAALQVLHCWSKKSNPGEVERIVNQHPLEEATTCIQYERLLNRLAPLRAFGDVRFKWDSKTQERVYSKTSIRYFTEQEHLYTPPYLTAEPEVTSYQLQRSDRFLVLATDGLWDMLSNEEVVHFVKQHVNKKNGTQAEKISMEVTYNDQELPCEMLNTASCLIREALGGDDHVSVSTSLSIPFPDVRMYRDDMTIIVIFFDWDQLEIPSESEPDYPIV